MIILGLIIFLLVVFPNRCAQVWHSIKQFDKDALKENQQVNNK